MGVPSTTRTRLSPEARQAQLVAIGLELLKTMPLDQLPLDEVAGRAGISRTLLFHHFGSKRAYQVALVEAAGALLMEVTEPDPEAATTEQLRAGIEAFLLFVDEHRGSYVALVRGAAASDDELGAVVERVRAGLVERVLAAAVPVSEPVDPFLRLRVRSWIALTEEAALQWTATHEPSLDELVAFLGTALLTCLSPPSASAPERETPARARKRARRRQRSATPASPWSIRSSSAPESDRSTPGIGPLPPKPGSSGTGSWIVAERGFTM